MDGSFEPYRPTVVKQESGYNGRNDMTDRQSMPMGGHNGRRSPGKKFYLPRMRSKPSFRKNATAAFSPFSEHPPQTFTSHIFESPADFTSIAFEQYEHTSQTFPSLASERPASLKRTFPSLASDYYVHESHEFTSLSRHIGRKASATLSFFKYAMNTSLGVSWSKPPHIS